MPFATAEIADRTRRMCAIVEQTVVAANQGAQLAHYPPFSWPGGSMIVDHDGRMLARVDPGRGEKVVVAPSTSLSSAPNANVVWHMTCARTWAAKRAPVSLAHGLIAAELGL